MANDYFQFKQFIVRQDHCAMKVCTDACVFGAYVARYIFNNGPVVGSILDIGTGTGLLALMMAQNTKGIVDAVEIDEAAFQQAESNFDNSPWRDRLNVFNADAFHFDRGKKYDWIISNPPFFKGDLKSANKGKNLAKHETMLTLEQLLAVISRHLSPFGIFAVLLPPHRAPFFIEIAGEAGYFLAEQVEVRHTSGHPVFREILFFRSGESTAFCDELFIKDKQGNYTPQFADLMKDYYL